MTSLPGSGNYPATSRSGDSLADLLERILDKGIVIAGDVVVNVLDIELLTLKLRLLIASVDTAKQMGLDWWQDDPFLSRNARSLQQENQQLRQRVNELEGTVPGSVGERQPDELRGDR